MRAAHEQLTELAALLCVHAARAPGLRLYSSSLLLCHDGDALCTCATGRAAGSARACGSDMTVRMIDFGQTQLPPSASPPTPGPDPGYVAGLHSLQAMLAAMLEPPHTFTA